MFNNLRKDEKVSKMVQKQESNDKNMNHENCKGINIEIKYERDEEYDKEDYVEDVVEKALQSLREWIQHKAIEGAHSLNKVLEEDLGDIEKWMIAPKVVHRKTSAIAEIVLQVKTNASTYQLHHSEKEYCDRHAMHISTKNAQNAHAKRIGFITRTYVKLASTKYYNKELSLKGQIDKTLFEIKKGNAAERGVKSKALVVHAVEEKAQEVSLKLQQIQTKRYKFMPYKNATVQERLAAMQGNDMMNIQARYETLHNAKVDNIICADNKNHNLEDYILNAKHNDQPLFIAVEPGSGMHENDAHAVLNPRMKYKAREWLVDVYPTISFTFENDNKTSVNAEEFRNTYKYNESLKEFLSPILNQREAKKMKKYVNKTKTHAQALKPEDEVKEKDKSKEKPKEVNLIGKSKKENEEISNLKEVIKKMEMQIENLKDIMTQLCEVIGMTNDKKNAIKGKMVEIAQGTNNNSLKEQEEDKINYDNCVVNIEKKELRQKRKDERKPLQPIWRSESKTHGISIHKKVKINEKC